MNIEDFEDNIWFTADHHFGHTNIIKFQNRPFQNCKQMDSMLIKRWNESVKENDVVYHLGDFSYKTSVKYVLNIIEQLNGQIVLIPGNHDKNTIKAFRQLPLYKQRHDVFPFSVGINVNVYNADVFKRRSLHIISNVELQVCNKRLILCHYPMESWPASRRGTIHLHGHSHGKSQNVEGRIDVGVDSWNFYPVSLGGVLCDIDRQNQFSKILYKKEK